MVDKRFKIIQNREEFSDKDFPSSMTDYANLNFENYIPDNDIEEKILTENPVPSNLQEVSILNGFVKALLVLQTAQLLNISADQQMGKFQEKSFQVMGPLSRLWKGLEDVRNESSEAVQVPVNTFATLIEQVTLLLGASITINSYTHRLNTLKTVLKDSRKAKTLLKEKGAILEESESHLFGKKIQSHIIGIERSRKQSLEVFKVSNDKNTPFRKAPLPYEDRPRCGGQYYLLHGKIK